MNSNIPARSPRRRRAATVALSTIITATGALAGEQALRCDGHTTSISLVRGDRAGPTPATLGLKIRREEGKVYLSLSEGPFIEAEDTGTAFRYRDDRNVLGSSSLSINYRDHSMHYEAIADRHGEPMARFIFEGVCEEDS